LTLSELTGVSGSEGDFTVSIRQLPRYVDTDKCIACGVCAEKCPKKVVDTYNEGLTQRKAIYVPYSQAVPLKYTIDAQNCIFFQKGKCRACEKFCPSGAINFEDTEKELTLKVGSIIVAPGFNTFDPGRLDQYNHKRFPDVVTSMEFERILSSTGPYSGHLIRPSSKQTKNDHGNPPKKIAWLQCVGSRDQNGCNNGYCSSVCCMVAVKQALMSKEHSRIPLACAIFYMDMRSQGKDFDRYVENAKKLGVRFIRSRIHTVEGVPGTSELCLRYAAANGKVAAENFDMVVLSTGLEVDPAVIDLSATLGIDLDHYHFTRSDGFDSVATSVPGIYACGAFTGPKDIPSSVMEASAAASAASEKLAPARGSCTRVADRPPEQDVARKAPRIGVFVCNCGINIGGIVRVPEVVAFSKTLPGVVYVEENLFTCSQDTQDNISKIIVQENLNRIVIAACTPRTHEGLFQETLTNAGLNKFLVEIANIRNHDSWVHSNNPDAATEKAKDLVRMAVAKVALLNPLAETDLPVSQSALVVGGGVAGLTTALTLARHGYPVDLIERSEYLGGNARQLNKTFKGEDIGSYVKALIGEVEAMDNIRVHLGTKIRKVQGFVGNFRTELSNGSGGNAIEHGVAILATGAREYQPEEYLFGEHPAVVTHSGMDALFRNKDTRIEQATGVVFIQCVGSRNAEHPYCSKVCCTHTVKSALALKEKNPAVNVVVLYRDIRTYGIREDLYREARHQGVLFFPYTPEEKPVVTPQGDRVRVSFDDPIIGRRLSVDADILCLASAIVSYRDQTLAQAFKVPYDENGWLMEAHQKLRPVEFPVDGVFLCGMAHYPKPIEESIAQARAAASRALTVLSRDHIQVGGTVARIETQHCSGCQTCLDVCPFGAIAFDEEKGVAEINPALCKGCGNCAAACPSEAVVLMGFNNRQLYAQFKCAFAA